MIKAGAGRPKFQLTANVLKFIAIIAMTVDHVSFSFPQNGAPRAIAGFIGLTAAPTMFYFAVEGYHHTRNIKRYMLRLAVFAAISWFPFSYFINGGMVVLSVSFFLGMLNVIFTILLGVLAVHIRRKVKNTIAKTLLILLTVVLSAPANWAYLGIIITLIFECFYGNFKKQALGYCVFVLLCMALYMNLPVFITGFFTEGFFNPQHLVISDGFQQMGMFVPIILLYFYNGQKGKGGAFSKWFFYIYYPLHLLVLGFLSGLSLSV